MPSGQVVRYTTTSGHGMIEYSGGRASVQEQDMASNARFEGAHVDFDVVHGKPFDRAVNVVLHTGTHHNPKHRRFGDTR